MKNKYNILIILAILILGVFTLINLEKPELEAEGVSFYIPRYASVCCEEGTPSHPLIRFSTNPSPIKTIVDKGDLKMANYECIGSSEGKSCTMTLRPDGISCPDKYEPWYFVKINDECACYYYGDHGIPHSSSMFATKSVFCRTPYSCGSSISFKRGDKISITATCFKDVWFSWQYKDAFVPPSNINIGIEQKEMELFYYGHDIIKDDIEGTQQCLLQKFYNEKDKYQPKDTSKMPDEDDYSLKNWLNNIDVFAQIGNYLSSGKEDKKIISNQESIPLQDCYLSVYDYRKVVAPGLNIKYYNDEPVYCDSNQKKLISFNEITTKTGAKYNVPRKVVKENIECCEDADCPGAKCGSDFKCTTAGHCWGDQDCPEPTYSTMLADGKFLKTFYECKSNVCVKDTKRVECSHAYCQSLGMWCDEEKGCRGNKIQCPYGKCCDGSSTYIDKSCSSLGYSSAYKCCLNLDTRQGVGECKTDCNVGCNYNKKCEIQFGETVDTCSDCYKCGDGILSPGENCKTCKVDMEAVYGKGICKDVEITCKPFDFICIINRDIINPLNKYIDNLFFAFKTFTWIVALIGFFVGFGVSYEKLEKQFKKEKEQIYRIGLSLLAGGAVGYMVYQYFGIGTVLLALYIIGKVAVMVIK